MNNLVILYTNSFAVLVLLLILKNYRLKFRSICCEEKVFVLFTVATLVMLVGEAAIENLFGVPGGFVHVLLYFLQTMDYTLAVIIPMLWLYYCVYRIYHISSIAKKSRKIIALPAILYTVLIVISLHNGAAFKILESNLYGSGFAYVLSYVVGLLYVSSAAVLVLINRKSLNHGEIVPYLLVPIIPLVLAIGEILFTPLKGLMWAGATLVILEIQMLVLNNRTNIDHLTSLNNRMALDGYLRRMIHESHSTQTRLGVIMIDVDDFKSINDRFGHVEGDRALKATGDILRQCFSGNFFIARYGGDEFTVVLKDSNEEILKEYLEKLDSERVKHNTAANRPYEICLSVGATVFTDSEITSLHSLYMKVDSLMYKDKFGKKGKHSCVR